MKEKENRKRRFCIIRIYREITDCDGAEAETEKRYAKGKGQ